MDDIKADALRARVILVEDDQAVLNALKFSIELEGIPVDAYASGETMLTGAPMPARGCLVLDYHLTGMNGLDLLMRLRAKGVRLPALLITTNPSPAVRARAAGMGAAIVEKPLLTDRLTRSIVSALAEPAPPSP
jgi:FixJ family two-component response regulator